METDKLPNEPIIPPNHKKMKQVNTISDEPNEPPIPTKTTKIHPAT
jgi:hypothetical protein